MATNPDNVGGQTIQPYEATLSHKGLPPLPKLQANIGYVLGGRPLYSDHQVMEYAIAYGELCRAAPAGGGCRENSITRYTLKAEGNSPDSWAIFPEKSAAGEWCKFSEVRQAFLVERLNSAPAGSGEVEAWLREVDGALCTPRQKILGLVQDASTYTVPLLRKLQQPSAIGIEAIATEMENACTYPDGSPSTNTILPGSVRHWAMRLRKLQQGAD